MRATVVLVATVISLGGNQAWLEEPLGDLLRKGDVGSVFHELRVGEDTEIVDVGTARVKESTTERTVLVLEPGVEIGDGHQARFEVPLARLTPSGLARLTALDVEDAEPEESERAPEPAALDLVERWRVAWETQNVPDYLECYSKRFRPADGASRGAWRKTRAARLRAPLFIEVRLGEIETDRVADDRVRVRFDQRFRSDVFSDLIRKELVLVLEGENWRIVRERAAP